VLDIYLFVPYFTVQHTGMQDFKILKFRLYY